MINSYTSSAQDVAVNGLITFASDSINDGCGYSHVEGAPSFKLRHAGRYLVSFSGCAATQGTAGNITAQLLSNGSAVAGAQCTFYSAADTNVGSVGFTTIITVPCSCCVVNNAQTLTIQNLTTAATYNNVNLSIVRLDQ